MRLEPGCSEDSFAAWLLDIGHGRNLIPDSNKILLRSGMQTSSLDSLIKDIYPGISTLPTAPPPEFFLERAILAPRNVDVDLTNHEILGQMHGEEQIYMSADSIVKEQGADGPDDDPIPPEVLRTFDASGLPPGELHLKPGCPIILLRNLSPARGLCNGTRMIVNRSSDRVLEVKIIGGDHHGETALIPRISLIPSAHHADFTFMLKRRQFPVRLAFALTINKSQGQSLRYVGVDLRSSVFTHGQLYVAFSRATSSQRIRVLLPPEEILGQTPNVVFPEILLD
jgi:ATP-dependent exoDNAse (exonuclease V) alpha subunit